MSMFVGLTEPTSAPCYHCPVGWGCQWGYVTRMTQLKNTQHVVTSPGTYLTTQSTIKWEGGLVCFHGTAASVSDKQVEVIYLSLHICLIFCTNTLSLISA